jgi:hypothetical protein
VGLKAGNGADGAGLAELVDVGGVEGAGAVETQGHGFDVDAEDPGGVGAGPADQRGGEDGRGGEVVLAFYFVDGLCIVSWWMRDRIIKRETYQGLAVEAVLAGGNQALDDREGVAVEANVAVDALARSVLQPQPAVDNVAQVWVDAGGSVLVVVGKGQVEHVAGADEVGAVALDKGMEAGRGQGEDVEGMAQGVEAEDVGGPAVDVRDGGKVLAVLDLELGLAGEVVGALGFGEAGEARAGVDEVGEDLVDDFDGEGFKVAGCGVDMS